MKYLKMWWARLLLGVTAMGSLTVLLLTKQDDSLDPRGLWLTGLAIVVWAVSELPDRVPHQHDLELFKRFCSSFDDATVRFLKEQDFGAVFHQDKVNKIHQFAADWTGSAYEFEDRKLKSACADVVAKAKALSNLISTHSWPARGAEHVMTTKPDQLDKATLDRVAVVNANLNTAADELRESVERLDRQGRKKLGASSVVSL